MMFQYFNTRNTSLAYRSCVTLPDRQKLVSFQYLFFKFMVEGDTEESVSIDPFKIIK